MGSFEPRTWQQRRSELSQAHSPGFDRLMQPALKAYGPAPAAVAQRRRLSAGSRFNAISLKPARRRACSNVCCIESPGAALNPVKGEGAVHTLPEIEVLHRDHFAVAFPLPLVRAPLFKSVLKATRNVFARRDESNSRWLIQRFEATHNRQELQAFALNVGLGVRYFDLVRAVSGLEHEPPIAGISGLIGGGKEHKVRNRYAHRSASGWCTWECRPAGIQQSGGRRVALRTAKAQRRQLSGGIIAQQVLLIGNSAPDSLLFLVGEFSGPEMYGTR